MRPGFRQYRVAALGFSTLGFSRSRAVMRRCPGPRQREPDTLTLGGGKRRFHRRVLRIDRPGKQDVPPAEEKQKGRRGERHPLWEAWRMRDLGWWRVGPLLLTACLVLQFCGSPWITAWLAAQRPAVGHLRFDHFAASSSRFFSIGWQFRVTQFELNTRLSRRQS
jgi:hypothetical protein